MSSVFRTLLPLALAAATLHPGMSVGAVRGAYVEAVQPSRPFNGSVNGENGSVSLGPGSSGVLGVTAITLTNLGSAARTIFVFAPIFSSGFGCGSTNVIGGGFPRFYVIVPAGQTVHLTYPTPMVYPPISGQSCIAFSGATNVDITVNGFLN